MQKLYLLLLLFYFIYGAKSQVIPFKVSGRYQLLGQVTNVVTSSDNYNGQSTWIFLSLNIPGLAIGTFNGYFSKITAIFSHILTSRPDVAGSLGVYYNRTVDLFDMIKLCNLSNSSIIQGKVLTGKFHIFIKCYDTKTDKIDWSGSPNFTAPLVSVEPANCTSDKRCTEGYCGMFQRKAYIYSKHTISTKEDYYCPNDLISFLFFEINNNLFTAPYLISLSNASFACIDKTEATNENLRSYPMFYWYLSCYDQFAVGKPEFKPFPTFDSEGNVTPGYPYVAVGSGNSKMNYFIFKKKFIFAFILNIIIKKIYYDV
uniref:Transmembrane protein n=1 Tax=Strongyloides venezuelensis TaxID=75913 RepID=A0A0K0F4K1_STRVS